MENQLSEHELMEQKAEALFGCKCTVIRKPQHGFASTNLIPGFLGEIEGLKPGHNNKWFVYKRRPGRPLKGEEPTKKISVRLPGSLLEWLDSLPGDRTSNLTQILLEAKNS